MNFEEAMDHLYNNYGHATAYEQALQCAIEGLHGKFLHLKERSDLIASEEMKMRDRYKARSQAWMEEALKISQRHSWRPIAQIHEDYGPCVLINLNDPGYIEIGSNLNTEFDESQWTHFTQISELTTNEADRLKSIMDNPPKDGEF